MLGDCYQEFVFGFQRFLSVGQDCFVFFDVFEYVEGIEEVEVFVIGKVMIVELEQGEVFFEIWSVVGVELCLCFEEVFGEDFVVDELSVGEGVG